MSSSSSSSSTVPLVAAKPSTVVVQTIPSTRLSKANRAHLNILPRRIGTRLRRSFSDKQLSDRGLIGFAAVVQSIIERVIVGAAECAKKAKKTRLNAKYVRRAIQQSPDLAKLFPGIIPGADRIPAPYQEWLVEKVPASKKKKVLAAAVPSAPSA